MRFGVILICCFTAVTIALIYIINNAKELTNKYKNLKTKNKKIICYTATIIFVAVIIVNCRSLLILKENLSFKKKLEFNENEYEKVRNEKAYYKNAMDNTYEKQHPEKPYIPDGFNYVEGEWDTGFVIEDERENQYVWVPCGNKGEDSVVKLQKSNYPTIPFISESECYDLEYEDMINSSLKYGGFYISRYEIGKEDDKPVSKADAQVWSNVDRNDALEIVDEFIYEDNTINCKLINGFAYDTCLLWIKQSNSIINENVDYSKKSIEEIYTGRIKMNNIYDLTDNIMDISSETYYGFVISRGSSFSEAFKDESRCLLGESREELIDSIDNTCIRTMLYID